MGLLPLAGKNHSDFEIIEPLPGSIGGSNNDLGDHNFDFMDEHPISEDGGGFIGP